MSTLLCFSFADVYYNIIDFPIDRRGNEYGSAKVINSSPRPRNTKGQNHSVISVSAVALLMPLQIIICRLGGKTNSWVLQGSRDQRPGRMSFFCRRKGPKCGLCSSSAIAEPGSVVRFVCRSRAWSSPLSGLKLSAQSTPSSAGLNDLMILVQLMVSNSRNECIKSRWGGLLSCRS
jgi:hypothetical protein